MKKKLTIKDKMNIHITLVCLLGFTFMGFLLYVHIAFIMRGQIKDNALIVADIASREIDGDLVEAFDSPDSPGYAEMYETLSEYCGYHMIDYIYILKRDANGSMRFVMDCDENDPASMGEYYHYQNAMGDALRGSLAFDRDIVSDRWGKHYSGYAPVFNSDGTVVAILCVDVSVKLLDDYLYSLGFVVVLLNLLFAMIAIVIYFSLSRYMRHRDYLTEVYSYDYLKKWGKKHTEQYKLRYYTAINVNIKNFKLMNKTYGAARGDEILARTAQALKGIIHRGEIVSRTGNDNFVLMIFKDRELEVIEQLENMHLFMKVKDEWKSIPVSFRAGIYDIHPGDQISEVLNMCSIALRKAREEGMPDYVRFNDEQLANLLKEKEVLDNFESGISNKEFVVYYQPKVDIVTKELCGCEALVRWFKDGRMVPPDDFIPYLEKSGHIMELDFFVFQQVCKHISEWQKMGIEPVRVSSNFSKLHLGNPSFTKKVMDVLTFYDVDAKYVDLELTESSGISNLKSLNETIERFKKKGIYTSMDDFGTGYSSLSLLQDVNFNVVKLDKSFFRNAEEENPEKQKMLTNVIHMIADLGREIICEGVETKEQMEFLLTTECHIAQGYFYDKPLPYDVFVERLKDKSYAHRA